MNTNLRILRLKIRSRRCLLRRVSHYHHCCENINFIFYGEAEAKRVKRDSSLGGEKESSQSRHFSPFHIS